MREDILSVPGSYITILEADVSPDAKNVRIYIDIFGNDKIHDKIILKLNEMVPFFRHKIAKRVTLRSVPEISFLLDKTQSKALDLEALIAAESMKYQEPAPQKKKSQTTPKKKK